MILRRVIAHFRKQEWTAIAIDFLIVVVGVFVGIQVSNWNAARAEARLGADYVKRLIRDLEEDLVGIRSQSAYYTQVLQSVQITDDLLRADNPDPRALVVNAYRASEISYTPPVRATWDQIVSSGHLGLLPDGAAEKGLSQYYSFDTGQDTYSMGVDSGYRRAVRKIIPMSVQAAMRADCSDIRDEWGTIDGFVEECKLDVDPAALEEVAALLRSDPAVTSELSYQYSFAVSAVLNFEGYMKSAEDALVALGGDPQAKGKAAS